ncbi:MAG TPA: hypothetical protein VNC50_08255 [Planctomycetia bacterium]|nr:hypothetical protein [Planctomycetia bacterium]
MSIFSQLPGAVCRALAALAIVVSGAAARGEESATALVARLGADDYRTREEAHRKLSAMGAAAAPALKEAAKSADVEKRLRAEALLRDLRRADLWAPSYVQWEARDYEVKEAFSALAKQSGNPIDWNRTSQSFGQEVTLDGVRRTYWNALDEICRQANVAVQFYDDPGGAGCVLHRGSPGKYPMAFAGPVRMRLQSIRRSEQNEIHFGDAAADNQRSLTVALQIHWEQRAALCRYGSRQRLLEATTDAGENLLPPQQRRYRESMMQLSRRTREILYTQTLTAPTQAATKIARLRFAVEMEIAGDFATLKTSLGKPGPAAESEGYRVQVESIRTDNMLTYATVLLQRPEALDSPSNSPELVDENFQAKAGGKTLRLEMGQQFGGRVQCRYVFQFREPPPADAELLVSVPRLRSRRFAEFAFKDIPLP